MLHHELRTYLEYFDDISGETAIWVHHQKPINLELLCKILAWWEETNGEDVCCNDTKHDVLAVRFVHNFSGDIVSRNEVCKSEYSRRLNVPLKWKTCTVLKFLKPWEWILWCKVNRSDSKTSFLKFDSLNKVGTNSSNGTDDNCS